ncbi:MAG TPA: hypothetical protein VK809_06850 [Bacteroidia bacterium]|jgi:hypothetical protein|nr:hypothetical protein [Bacteroidia bacterium]
MPCRKILGLFILFIALVNSEGFSQSSSAFYYHEGGVPSPHPYQEPTGRPFKMSIDAGLVFGFASVSGIYTHYASGISTSMGYTFGLIEEIPIQKRSYIEAGIEILEDQVKFNSYFFVPGASFLYDNNLVYFHDIVMNEIQVPVLYKFPLSPTDRKNRSIYATFGAKFRFISYSNSSVTNDSNGYLVYQGQKDVSFLYKLFSPFGSPIFEASIGYQRNTKKKRKRGWYMNLEYNYGLSPLVYTGNRSGSNDVVFRLNTLIFKIGKIF